MAMAETQEPRAKARPKRLTEKEKRAQAAEAARKARLQWYAIGAVLVIAAIAAIVLISIFTEGSLPQINDSRL